MDHWGTGPPTEDGVKMKDYPRSDTEQRAGACVPHQKERV